MGMEILDPIICKLNTEIHYQFVQMTTTQRQYKTACVSKLSNLLTFHLIGQKCYLVLFCISQWLKLSIFFILLVICLFFPHTPVCSQPFPIFLGDLLFYLLIYNICFILMLAFFSFFILLSLYISGWNLREAKRNRTIPKHLGLWFLYGFHVPYSDISFLLLTAISLPCENNMPAASLNSSNSLSVQGDRTEQVAVLHMHPLPSLHAHTFYGRLTTGEQVLTDRNPLYLTICLSHSSHSVNI